jgi:predicted nuclease of predicted toxin-antitoxin system
MGHEVITADELQLGESDDVEIVGRAAALGCCLLTMDVDFGKLFVEGLPRVQIVLLRPPEGRADAVNNVLRSFLKAAAIDDPEFQGCLIVVKAGGFRVRRPE